LRKRAIRGKIPAELNRKPGFLTKEGSDGDVRIDMLNAGVLGLTKLVLGL
jgi:hypothetical protein